MDDIIYTRYVEGHLDLLRQVLGKTIDRRSVSELLEVLVVLSSARRVCGAWW